MIVSSQAGLVQKLISFLKRPDALDRSAPVRNAYDDYEPHELHSDPEASAVAEAYAPPARVTDSIQSTPSHASRLDALVMRAVQQFNAQFGFVVRYDPDGKMHYCTGRDLRGRYVPHTEIRPDRRALSMALDSGESQLALRKHQDNTTVPVLCGPLWDGNEVIGALYLDNPARSRLHRGVFDVFCNQAARMLREGAF